MAKYPVSRKGVFGSLAGRLKYFVRENRRKGDPLGWTLVYRLPLRLIEKVYERCVEFVNVCIYNRFCNEKRFRRFQQENSGRQRGHYYSIVMPGSLRCLEICLSLVPEHVQVFLIANGLGKTEKRFFFEQYAGYPVFALSLLPGTSLKHGRVLNLLLRNNEYDFGIIDYDLFLFNPEIFAQVQLRESDMMTGLYSLKNKRSGHVFPTTHFLYFNIAKVKEVMTAYGIGAQEYKRIPRRLQKQLLSIGLGYHNFLKEYLPFFDTLNMIMAMGFSSGMTANILPSEADDSYHLGGHVRAEDEEEVEKVLARIELMISCRKQKEI